jgi:23S rRNA pseudouridine2605 synthase
VASRRKAEELIAQGLVTVNGSAVTRPGVSVDPRRDRVEVEGRRVRPEKLVYWLINKPTGMVTTVSDPQGRPTVLSLLPEVKQRMFPVGRLDFKTEGALLLTNDGPLANDLLHPGRRVPKVYLARLRGQVDRKALRKLSEGVMLEDGMTAPAEVELRKRTRNATWVELTVWEGRNRLIRRMAEAIRHPVLRLIRVSFAGLSVENMGPGQVRKLRPAEVQAVKSLIQ